MIGLITYLGGLLMKNLDEAFELLYELNEEAHGLAWDSWIAADEYMESEDESDWETAEEMRSNASLEQASYFRDLYYELEESDKEALIYYAKNNEDFKDEFMCFFGEEEFMNNFK